MFYLKYRPQTVSEIDNTVVRERLEKLLSQESLPHALLFTGPKGTGKTSSARIVAKAINCLTNAFAKKSKVFEPCNRCQNCLAISSGSSIDVIEMDAASNRKIDEMRDLIDKVKFLPAHNRFKVYIIDEVHMLTTESFNALLKTLEEPPSQTLFILATTESSKLPKTIISRCIRVMFPRAKRADVVHMLSRITKSEKLSVDEPLLELIADNCDNSFRDATKLLEQAIAQNELSIEGIKNLIGLSDFGEDLLALIESKKITSVLKYLEIYQAQGGSFKALIEYHLQNLHTLLLAKNGVATENTKNYNFSIREISKLIRLFQEAYTSLKYSPIESLPLEIAMVDFFSYSQKGEVN